MSSTLSIAASGLQQFQSDINVIGNNMANVDTTGFKDARMNFEDAISVAVGGANGQVGTGVTTASITSNFNQGTPTSTGQPSDLAISGNGFFVVKNSASGAEYATRDGTFTVDPNGYLLTSGGFRVQGYSDAGLSTLGDIKIDATGAPSTAAAGAGFTGYTISNTGTITVTLSDGTSFVRGQVLLQAVNDPNTLVNAGDNLYSNFTVSLAAAGTGGLGSVLSGYLEASNVDLTNEMSNLILAQRAFEANSKMVTTTDEILQDLVNLKR
jgi:flagellar hook protein FlgE